jgi:hypothetical protein
VQIKVFAIPSCDVHRELGQQDSETPPLDILRGRAAIMFSRSASARLLADFITDVAEFFPDDDFFPHINSLYDDMSGNTATQTDLLPPPHMFF